MWVALLESCSSREGRGFLVIKTFLKICLLALVTVSAAWPVHAAGAKRGPASVTAPTSPMVSGASSSPLDVRGQNRAWSKMVRARGDKESVNFVPTRRDYRAEIEGMRF